MDIRIGMEVWHVKHHKGVIQGENGMMLSINFEEVGLKSISVEAFGHGLYLDQAEVNYTDYQYLIEKYNTPPHLLGYTKIVEEKFYASVDQQGENRSFVVLAIKKVKTYFRIYALDVKTANVILLVDENGKDKGLHTEQDYLLKLRPMHVISAFVKPVEVGEYVNALRIARQIQLVGESNLKKLEEKYKNFLGKRGYPHHNLKMTFQQLFAFAQLNEGNEVAGIVRFSNTEIRFLNGKASRYQMKMGPIFSDLEKGLLQPNENTLYYRGDALVKAYVPRGKHRAKVTVLHLFVEPSSIPFLEEPRASLESRAWAFIHGDITKNAEMIDEELHNALCDRDGTLTKHQVNLYEETLYLRRTPIQYWNLNQKTLYFEGLIFRNLQKANPNIDYKQWINREKQELPEVDDVVEKIKNEFDSLPIDFNLSTVCLRNDFLLYLQEQINKEYSNVNVYWIDTQRYRLYTKLSIEFLNSNLKSVESWDDASFDKDYAEFLKECESFDMEEVGKQDLGHNEIDKSDEHSLHYEKENSYFLEELGYLLHEGTDKEEFFKKVYRVSDICDPAFAVNFEVLTDEVEIEKLGYTIDQNELPF